MGDASLTEIHTSHQKTQLKEGGLALTSRGAFDKEFILANNPVPAHGERHTTGDGASREASLRAGCSQSRSLLTCAPASATQPPSGISWREGKASPLHPEPPL